MNYRDGNATINDLTVENVTFHLLFIPLFRPQLHIGVYITYMEIHTSGFCFLSRLTFLFIVAPLI